MHLLVAGGRSVFHSLLHFSKQKTAYERVVRDIFEALYQINYDGVVHSYTTKMAGNRYSIWTSRSGTEDTMPKNLETNEDVRNLLVELMIDPKSKIIFLPAAMCDFDAL